MYKRIGKTYVGIRAKETQELLAAYPQPVEGDFEKIEDQVRFWYYQQSCEAEDFLQNTYVDVLNEHEIKSMGIKKT